MPFDDKNQIHHIHENLLQKWLQLLGEVPAKWANPLINDIQTFVLNSRKMKEPEKKPEVKK